MEIFMRKTLEPVLKWFYLFLFRLFPILLAVLNVTRSVLASSGDSPAWFPLESGTLLMLVFTTFGLSEILSSAPQILRMVVIFSVCAVPCLIAEAGGWLTAKRKWLGLIVFLLPFVVDVRMAIVLNSPIAAIADACVIVLAVLGGILRKKGILPKSL